MKRLLIAGCILAIGFIVVVILLPRAPYPKVLGPALKGHGLYVLVSYNIAQDSDASSFAVSIIDLSYDGGEIIERDGKEIMTQPIGAVGISLKSQTMSNVDFGFWAYGPVEVGDEETAIKQIADYLQEKYPYGVVKTTSCPNGYFERCN